MRHIIFFSVFPLEYGGGLEKYYIDQAHELSKLDDTKVSIIHPYSFWVRIYLFLFSVVSGGKKSFTRREDPVHIRKILGKVSWMQRSFHEMSVLFSNADVLYTKNEIIDWLLLSFIRISKTCVVIAGVHTPSQYTKTSFFNRVRNILYTSRFYRFLVRKVNIFHVINKNEKQTLERLFPDKKVFLLHNPFDFEAFAQNLDTTIDGLPEKKSRYTVAWVGRLTHQKGILELISIIDALYTKDRNGYQWVICGDGELTPLVLEAAKKYDSIIFLRHVSNKKIRSVLLRCDSLLSTSLFDTLGYTIMEAQACNLPVVAFDTAGSREIIDHGVNGYIVHSKEECLRYIEFLKKNKGELIVDIRTYIQQKFSQRNLYDRSMLLFSTTQDTIKDLT